MVLQLTDRLIHSADTVAEGLAGDHLVLDLSSGCYYGLGEVGGFIWEQLDGKRELNNIVDAVSAKFEVESAQAGEDVLQFVSQLIEVGLVQNITTR